MKERTGGSQEPPVFNMADLLMATEKVPPSFRFERRRIRAGETFLSKSERMTKALLQFPFIERARVENIEPEVDTPPAPTVEMKVIDYRTPSLPSSDVIVVAQPPRKRGRPRKVAATE